MAFKNANFPGSQLPLMPTPEGKCTIHATATTDIWRKPPNIDVLDAPMIYKSMAISDFKRARVTATGDWKTLYDQGGLVLLLPPKNSGTPKRWIKCGIEFYGNKPCMSVVAADEWADWSLVPLSGADAKLGRMAVEMEREVEEDGKRGTVLRISLLGELQEKLIIREVTWAFHDSKEDAEMFVGIYAAKPTKDDREELVVQFEGFEIESSSGPALIS